MDKADLIVLGAGLSGTLAAFRCKQLCPGARVLLVDRRTSLGRGHTWSFHASDLPAASLQWVAALGALSWPGYRVRFPAFERSFEGGYHTLRSETFYSRAGALLGDSLCLGADVSAFGDTWIEIEGRGRLEASLVLDARGIEPGARGVGGYQKFLGQVFRLKSPHGLSVPTLMDATVRQLEGYRFFYTLPLGPDSLLVEDTRYSLDPTVDEGAFREQVSAYAVKQGWQIEQVLDEEQGSLPIPLTSALPWLLGRPALGMRAGLFNPTTGYCLPHAVRAAETLARALKRGALPGASSWIKQCRKSTRSAWFYFYLNRMLFSQSCESRYRLLERFYRLPTAVVRRFYASRLRILDFLAVLLWGKPPISILSAARLIVHRKESYG